MAPETSSFSAPKNSKRKTIDLPVVDTGIRGDGRPLFDSQSSWHGRCAHKDDTEVRLRGERRIS